MPPLPLLPNQPTGSPDWYPSMGYGPSSTASAAATDPYAEVRRWQEKLAELTDRALTEQNAFNKLQLQQQREDAERALQNAMNIAKLQAETSRYGTDAQTRTTLARLQEDQRQFDLRHGLDQQKLGLDYATAYTNFAQTPDNPWLINDFTTAVGNVAAGGVPVYASDQAAPHAKNWEDFAALAGFGNMTGIGANGAAASGGGGGGGGGSQADLRLKAMKAIGEAMPPSEGVGHDDQDWAAINAFKNLYFAGKPDTASKLGATRMKIGLNGLKRAGYNTSLLEEQRIGALPGQGSARAY